MTAEPARLDLRADPEADLKPVIEQLRAGGAIAYPTETVYGLGSACTPEGISAVRALKGRAADKPLIALVASLEAVSALRWTDGARELAGIFWPGPLTLVLEDPAGIFPSGVRHDEDGTVGVRVSPHPLVTRLVEALGGPLTSTSLNTPGECPATSGHAAADVVHRLGGTGVLVLDVGTLPPSGPSTVVDCTGELPRVIREGTVPIGRLRCAIPEIHAERPS